MAVVQDEGSDVIEQDGAVMTVEQDEGKDGYRAEWGQ